MYAYTLTVRKRGYTPSLKHATPFMCAIFAFAQPGEYVQFVLKSDFLQNKIFVWRLGASPSFIRQWFLRNFTHINRVASWPISRNSQRHGAISRTHILPKNCIQKLHDLCPFDALTSGYIVYTEVTQLFIFGVHYHICRMFNYWLKFG